MTQDQLSNSQATSLEMGKKGEAFALAYERKRLPSFLHDKIVHLGQYEVARGYDILSCETQDSILPDRYIEVKTYKGHPHFYWSDNEIAAARNHSDHYYLYLIDIDRINEENYEPTIIPNPALLFNKDSQWSYQVQQYVFTLNSYEHIPTDWDSSSILIGCYKNEQHLIWILNHHCYNVRSQKNAPGAININNPQVKQARYLILYNIANPQVYMLYSLSDAPKSATKTEVQAMDYPDAHAFYYLLHPILKQIDSFYIDLRSLLREINHTSDRTPGSPVYLNGSQLRRFMVNEANVSSTEHSIRKSKSSWSKDQDNLLKEYFFKALDFEEIAQRLNHATKEVIHRAYQLGLIKPRN